MHHDQLELYAKKVVRSEVARTVEVLQVLNRIYKEKLWRRRGFDIFHKYCAKVLRMSEDSAARRLHVAELLARYN